MEKKFTILIALVFILSAMVPFALSSSTTTTPPDETNAFYITEDLIDDATDMGDRKYADEDFCWTHEIDLECKNILSAKLVINAEDIDDVDPEENVIIRADGTILGELEITGHDLEGETEFPISDLSILDDGEVEVCVEFDDEPGYGATIIWSKLIIEWVPCLKVEKEIVGGEYDPPEFVPIFTTAWWDLKITVENPNDGYDDPLNGIWVYDGIGAKLDLVKQWDGFDWYIFKIDTSPVYLGIDDDEYYGDDDDVDPTIMWRQANGKPAPAKNPCATNIWWNVDDLDDGDPAVTLEFRVTTITFEVGPKNHPTKDPKIKHAFTSTCHHELNDGPIGIYWFEDNMYCSIDDPVIVSVYDPTPGVDSDGDEWYDTLEVDIYGTDPCDEEDYPESFRLIAKDGSWGPAYDPVTDGPYGILTYDPIGPTFDFEFEGYGLVEGIEYSLIYYADGWPGDNPGALLGTGTPDGSGYIYISDNIELGMDLPHTDDANHPDSLPAIPGAKIWLVLSSDYDEAANSMIGWQPAEYLFEEETWDRVFYDDTDV